MASTKKTQSLGLSFHQCLLENTHIFLLCWLPIFFKDLKYSAHFITFITEEKQLDFFYLPLNIHPTIKTSPQYASVHKCIEAPQYRKPWLSARRLSSSFCNPTLSTMSFNFLCNMYLINDQSAHKLSILQAGNRLTEFILFLNIWAKEQETKTITQGIHLGVPQVPVPFLPWGCGSGKNLTDVLVSSP